MFLVKKRVNSKGFDINDEQTLAMIENARNVTLPNAYAYHCW